MNYREMLESAKSQEEKENEIRGLIRSYGCDDDEKIEKIMEVWRNSGIDIYMLLNAMNGSLPGEKPKKPDSRWRK